MESDQAHRPPEEEQVSLEKHESQTLSPVLFLPYDVQLQNTFCIEIIAKRFPMDIVNMPRVQINLEDVEIDTHNSRAQVTVHIWTVFDENTPSFDISFKLLGLFSYTESYSEEEVHVFLEQGSLSILLPFARELLLSICNRLQVPPMMLTMVKLAPHPSLKKPSHQENFDNQ